MRTANLLLLALLTIAAPLAAEAPASLVPPPPLVPERGQAICLRCHGSGKLVKEKAGLKWEGSSMKSFQVNCLTCNGAGKLIRDYTPAERLEKQEQRLAQMHNEQLTKGNLSIGAAYLPAEELETLSPEDHAAIAREYPQPCEKCFGLGYACCKKCDGTGMKDDEKERKKREREEERDRQENKGRISERKLSTRHPHADADTLSAAQSGETLTCDRCFGEGKSPCKKCKGIGSKPICKKCDGRGLIQRKARKNRPETVELCKPCKGTGRK